MHPHLSLLHRTVRWGGFLKEVKAKMNSEGPQIILKKRQGFLDKNLGNSMCKEPGISSLWWGCKTEEVGRKSWMEIVFR